MRSSTVTTASFATRPESNPQPRSNLALTLPSIPPLPGCHNASSCPYNTTDPHLSIHDQMRFLTTDQALEDLATFARAKQASSELGKRRPWVLIGGSYPGMLAAFARARFPDVFECAVASSAPVHARLDFVGFQDSVTRGYQMNVDGVRGSKRCAQQIGDGHKEVRTDRIIILRSKGL